MGGEGDDEWRVGACSGIVVAMVGDVETGGGEGSLGEVVGEDVELAGERKPAPGEVGRVAGPTSLGILGFDIILYFVVIILSRVSSVMGGGAFALRRLVLLYTSVE